MEWGFFVCLAEVCVCVCVCVYACFWCQNLYTRSMIVLFKSFWELRTYFIGYVFSKDFGYSSLGIIFRGKAGFSFSSPPWEFSRVLLVEKGFVFWKDPTGCQTKFLRSRSVIKPGDDIFGHGPWGLGQRLCFIHLCLSTALSTWLPVDAQYWVELNFVKYVMWTWGKRIESMHVHSTEFKLYITVLYNKAKPPLDISENI